MDGVEQLTTVRRAIRSAGRAAGIALLLVACAAPLEPPGMVVIPPLYEATVAAPIDLQTGIRTLDPGDAAILDRKVPDDLSPVAYRLVVFGRGDHVDPQQRPTQLVVGTPFPRAVRANVLCLVDARQVPCSDDAAVWRVEFDEPAMALLELPEAGGRRDIILVEERDGRPEGIFLVSQVRPLDGWDVPFSTIGNPPPEIANPLGGCDWVLFMDDLDPTDSFRRLRIRHPGPVYMVISVCPDLPSGYEMVPLIIINETTVAEIDVFQPFVAQPGTTYAWKLPDELLDSTDRIRGAIVRRSTSGGSYWITHPLITRI